MVACASSFHRKDTSTALEERTSASSSSRCAPARPSALSVEQQIAVEQQRRRGAALGDLPDGVAHLAAACRKGLGGAAPRPHPSARHPPDPPRSGCAAALLHVPLARVRALVQLRHLQQPASDLISVAEKVAQLLGDDVELFAVAL